MLSTLLLALAPGVASAWSAQALSTSAAKPATSFQNRAGPLTLQETPDIAALRDQAAALQAKLDAFTSIVNNPGSSEPFLGHALDGLVVPTSQDGDAEPVAVSNEDAAKAAWLAKLDKPPYGAAAPVVAASVTHVASAIPASAPPLAASEDAAKAAWLAKLDVPSFVGRDPTPAPVAAPIATEPVAATSEDAAKAAWLAKLDVPSFGGRGVHAPVAAPIAEPIAVTNYAEDAAKAAWLAKLDVHKFGVPSEAAAKAAWLAKLDVTDFAGRGVTPAPVAAEAVAVTNDAEAAAKAAWLAKLDEPKFGIVSEAAAKAAWLAKLDVTDFARPIAIETLVAEPVATEAIDAPVVSAEDAAKAAWLNNQVTANYWPVRRSASHSASEDEAKAAWLATLDKSVPKSPSPSVKDDAKEPTANFEWAEVPTPSIPLGQRPARRRGASSRATGRASLNVPFGGKAFEVIQ